MHDLSVSSWYLLAFLEPGSTEPRWHGYAYACLMFVTAFIQSIVLHQYFRIQTLIGMDIRTVLISAVYRKSLRLSSAARCNSTTGEITNLMSIDAQRFCALMLNIHALWSAPLQVAVAIYLLWGELGPSVLAGIGILLAMIPINAFVARKSKILQVRGTVLTAVNHANFTKRSLSYLRQLGTGKSFSFNIFREFAHFKNRRQANFVLIQTGPLNLSYF
ncbi:unnamed protein product [Mesocestoides corti]|uniref:ABC transmembrane type-1 domain-containing protein n=1 Tax=Mesocestoides corti TaxID=53468 RepID=A0A0R3U6A9_MESCO|nr:unnamed protein product [Mesocestoides corti]